MSDTTGNENEGSDTLVEELGAVGCVNGQGGPENDDEIGLAWDRVGCGEEPGEQVQILNSLRF